MHRNLLLLGLLALSHLAMVQGFMISTKVNDLCIGGDLSNNSFSWVNLCDKKARDQQFVWNKKMVVAKATLDGSQIPLCLSAQQAPQVTLSICSDQDNWQQWKLESSGALVNLQMDSCATTENSPPSQGDNVLISPCDAAKPSSQQWMMVGAGKKSSGGLSGGSVFIILVIVFTVVYVVGGMAFKILVKGASGIEACPNIGFWRELPGLVNAGIAFTLAGCKHGTPTESYEEI